MTGQASNIFDLTDLAAALAAGDVIPIVDVSDTTGGPDGTTKKVDMTDFFGNIPVALNSSVGIQLGGAGAANLLDDAEKGTWTPALGYTTPGDESFAYTFQSGTYTKVGRLVTLSYLVFTSTHTYTTASGQLQMTGLPFTNGAMAGSGSGRWQGVDFDTAATELVPMVNASAATIWFSKMGDALGFADIDTTDTTSGVAFYFEGTVTYEV